MKCKKYHKNIDLVVNNGLCTGCGSCYSVCPNNCILIKEDKKRGVYLAKINYANCDNCGLCAKVCPQIDLLSESKVGKHEFFGENIFCFYGYATNANLRYNASSGGLITAISLFALRSRLVDGVISVGAKKDNPLRFEARICRTEKEILDCKGSKYCPVSVNKILKDIMQEKNDNKYIYIGLPCHLKGLKNVFSIYSKLKDKIKYVFGIFCSHTSNFAGTEFILKKYHIPTCAVKKLDYRGNGWPGTMSVITKEKINISSTTYWGKYFGNSFFTPIHCLLCDDFFSVDSDISFGDAWLDEFHEDKIGTSIGIVRTEIGQILIEKCKKEKKVFYDMLHNKEIKKSQREHILFKKDLIEDRRKMLLKQNHKISQISFNLKSYNKLMIFNANLSQRKFFRHFLLMLSGWLEELYFKVMNKIKFIFLKGA